jgi:hypothetical protein
MGTYINHHHSALPRKPNKVVCGGWTLPVLPAPARTTSQPRLPRSPAGQFKPVFADQNDLRKTWLAVLSSLGGGKRSLVPHSDTCLGEDLYTAM